MTDQRILIWFRSDLRSHDHEPLHRAIQANPEFVLPLYCFESRQFGQTSFGFPKTGAFRAQFLLESVADLRRSLQSLGSDLIIRQGNPEVVIPDLAKQLGITAVYYHQEVTSEEIAVEESINQALAAIGVKCQRFWGHTLYHPDDLPFEVSQLPEVFTNFRKQVEKESTINPTFPTPKILPPLPTVEPGDLPALSTFELAAPAFDDRA
ncbi:MAG: deoxyribodipyrimidine photo-lyase, partial [Leptolyngbyaceae cyanobacterium CAN_BIN12]|nr:deoxyribodipyrimidine photo-lyase [Leptolyngbyaceae cyanobacterium CAN_BIN12]